MPPKSNSLRQVTVHIPKSKYPFFMELVESLRFVKKIEVKEAPPEDKVLKNVKAGLKEVSLYKKVKSKTTPAKDL